MMKKYLPLILLLLTAMACNAGVSDIFGGGDDSEGFENNDPQSLAETLMALDTVIAQTTVDAASAQAATETPAPDSSNFCEVYTEFVNDLNRRVDEYSAVVAADGEAHTLAVAADEAMEVYRDRLAPVAPEEIQAEVEVLANMSLIGALSSPDSKPEAEPFLMVVDNYASENCGISLSE